MENENSPKPAPASFRLPGWSKAFILIVLVALSSVGYLTQQFKDKSLPPAAPSLEPESLEEISQRAVLADFSLSDADGKQKRLSEFRGSVVILSFWASWCTPCLVELPTFAEIEKRLGARGLKVLAVNIDEGDEGKVFAKEFWAKQNFNFPNLFDSDKKAAMQFEVEMLPSNFVIDREGRLVYSGFGANDWSSPQTIEFLEGILQEPRN